MSLIKYRPSRPSNFFGNFFDEYFNRSMDNFFGSDFGWQSPSINVKETENEYQVEVAAPGLEKGDFEINVDQDLLTISSKKEVKEEKVEDGKYTRREFNYTSFKRSFHLPESIRSEDISANYEHGVLKIVLPKKEEAKVETTRAIEIS